MIDDKPTNVFGFDSMEWGGSGCYTYAMCVDDGSSISGDDVDGCDDEMRLNDKSGKYVRKQIQTKHKKLRQQL